MVSRTASVHVRRIIIPLALVLTRCFALYRLRSVEDIGDFAGHSHIHLEFQVIIMGSRHNLIEQVQLFGTVFFLSGVVLLFL